MGLLLPALVGLCLVWILFLRLWLMLALCCPRVVVFLGTTLGLGLSLVWLVAAQAAVGVVLRVAVRVVGLSDAFAGSIGVHVGLICFSRVRDTTVGSRAGLGGLHGEALTIIPNEAVVALLGFPWGSQRVVFFGFWMIRCGEGKLLPGGRRTTPMHGSNLLTDRSVRIVGLGLRGSLHARSVRVAALSLGHESPQHGIWITWRSRGTGLAVHSIGISDSVSISISISIPKHGVRVVVLLCRWRGSTNGSSVFALSVFVGVWWGGKSGGGQRVAAVFKEGVARSRASRGRGVGSTGRLEEQVKAETP